LTGIGSAGTNVPAMGMVSAWFSPKRRGLAAGVVVAGSSLGLVASGAAVPPLLEHYPAAGWRVCWVVFGVAAIAVAACAGAVLRSRPQASSANAAPSERAEQRGADPEGGRATLLRLWESPYFRILAAIYFAFGFSYIIYATFFVEHLIRDLGLTKAQAGAVWFRIGVGSIASGFIWGGVSDRFGRRLALMLIFAMQGFCYQIAGFGTSLAAAYTSGVLFALTAWSIPAVVAAASGDAFGPKLAPAVLGWLTVAFGLGQVAGPYLAGILADATGSLSAPFSLAGAVALAFGAGGATLLRPPSPEARPSRP
jgi:MFS family permease